MCQLHNIPLTTTDTAWHGSILPWATLLIKRRHLTHESYAEEVFAGGKISATAELIEIKFSEVHVFISKLSEIMSDYIFWELCSSQWWEPIPIHNSKNLTCMCHSQLTGQTRYIKSWQRICLATHMWQTMYNIFRPACVIDVINKTLILWLQIIITIISSSYLLYCVPVLSCLDSQLPEIIHQVRHVWFFYGNQPAIDLGRIYKREISNRSTGQVLATTRIGRSNEKQKCRKTKFADKMQLKNMTKQSSIWEPSVFIIIIICFN